MRWMLVALVLCIFLGNPVLAQTNELNESLEGIVTSWPVTATGSVQTHADDFALRFDPSGQYQTFRLEAEEIALRMEWKRGFIVEGDSPATLTVERDSRTAVLANASLTLSRFQGEPLVFATASDQKGAFALRTTADTTWTIGQNPRIVAEGMSPDTQLTHSGDEPHFWYTAEGPVVEAKAAGILRLDGTFTLFLHNLEIDAQGEDGSRWSEWTGYQEQDSALAAKEYELRVTTAHIVNGTLVAKPTKPIEHYAKDLRVHVEGAVTAPSVSGQLTRATETFLFEAEPIELEGTGELHLQAEEATGMSQLHLRPSQGLRVENKAPVEIQEQTEALPAAMRFLAPLAALVLVTATTSGLMHTPPGRKLRHQAWSRRAAQAAHQGHWEQSSRCYHRALKARTDHSNTWHELIQSELQANHPHEAERLAQQAANIPGMDPWDLITQRATAAWLRGDRKALQDHLQRLKEGAPQMATSLTAALQIDPPPEAQEVLDGYA